jgi:GGDEF domain-containing protein
VPVLDRVTLYQQDGSGRWFGRSAGDLVPMESWPEPGRYPWFRLQLREGAPTDIYLEVRHSTQLTVPVRLVTGAAHHQRSQLEYLGLGLVMGALALLVLASLTRAFLLRDPVYAWYAAFCLLASLALASFTGVSAHLLWGDLPEWSDVAPGCLALLAASVAVLLVARLSVLVARTRWLATALHAAGWGGLLWAALYAGLPRHWGVLLLGGHLFVVAALCLAAATLTWRRGDPVGLWMLLGAVPLAVTVGVSLTRVTGLLPNSWLSEYTLVLALAMDLPLLFGAVDSRSVERRSVELRRVASASQDPLTGLLRRIPFFARMDQAVMRHQRRGEGATIAFIELANLDWIQKSRGAEAAEEALLRAVIKLRRLVRDVDTTGRIGENRFGLILEGIADRRHMQDLAQRLVAAGLMQEPDAARDSELHFHVAAVVLAEHAAPPVQLIQQLSELLGAMGPRTQRPIRFLEGSAPAGPEPDEVPAAGAPA